MTVVGAIVFRSIKGVIFYKRMDAHAGYSGGAPKTMKLSPDSQSDDPRITEAAFAEWDIEAEKVVVAEHINAMVATGSPTIRSAVAKITAIESLSTLGSVCAEDESLACQYFWLIAEMDIERHLRDQSLLQLLAKKGSGSAVRLVSDKKTLLEIIVAPRFKVNMVDAAARLIELSSKDDPILARAAIGADPLVGQMVVDSISSPTLLAEIKDTARHESVRDRAALRLERVK